jgi:hypothetical protein
LVESRSEHTNLSSYDRYGNRLASCSNWSDQAAYPTEQPHVNIRKMPAIQIAVAVFAKSDFPSRILATPAVEATETVADPVSEGEGWTTTVLVIGPGFSVEVPGSAGMVLELVIVEPP